MPHPDKAPKQTLTTLYSELPGFRAYPGPSLIPHSVDKYGRAHMAFWENSTAEIPTRPLDAPGMYYKGSIISHRYSADISRALHVDEWKVEIAKAKMAPLRQVVPRVPCRGDWAPCHALHVETWSHRHALDAHPCTRPPSLGA